MQGNFWTRYRVDNFSSEQGDSLTSQWYVLCCKPHKEQLISRQLRQMGFETYFPCIVDSHQKTGRLEIRPYFPGYVFVRVDLSEVSLSTFQWMPHTEGLVCFEGRPAHVPDRLLQAMWRNLLDGQTPVQPESEAERVNNLEAQRSETIEGYESLLDLNLSGAERVSGLLHILESLSSPPGPAQE